MKRLMEEIVFCGFVTCWRFAGAPTSRWPSFANATTDGVVRPPSAFGMTVGSPPSSTAIQELVVPRSIPMVLPIGVCSFDLGGQLRKSKPQCINPLPGCNGQTGTMRRGRLALVLALAGALPASAAASTILGTPRAEALRGSARGDLIDAVGGGRDTVRCGGGIDTVMADAADRVAGDCELVARRVAGDAARGPAAHGTIVEPHAAAAGPNVVAVYQAGRRKEGADALGFATSHDAGR